VKLPLGRIAEFIHGEGSFDREEVASGYSIDSRTNQRGELFLAVKGERLDGHDFVDAALERGAVGAVVAASQAERFRQKSRLMLVPEPLEALQRLGRAVRRLWNKPLIAVTGSAGKTTTKEAIAKLLETKFQVLRSEGNLNNHFGLPLQLLKLEPEHEMAVVELGMNHAGEITALATIAQPDIGVVTNVAPVHLGFFASVAEIARAKYELIESLPANGTAVLNADDEYVSQFGRDFAGRVLNFGIEHPSALVAQDIKELGLDGSEFDLVADGSRARARLVLIGRHNIYNALAAVTVAMDRGLSLEEAAAALALLKPPDKRGQVLQVGGATVINDCYNSNPRALASVVDALSGMAAKGRRIVVAGEMLELGPSTEELHRQAGEHLAEHGADVLVGVRGAARHIVDAARARGIRAEFVETPEDAGEWLAREVKSGDLVLLKASRGVKLEKALEKWKELVVSS
jgi:UDP-N-acetylmuramoyl-tripeptide--D-alanyl-D-alanine ligase